MAVAPALAGEACSLEVRLDGFVFDDRFGEALELSHVFEQRSVPVLRYNGDPTPLWYRELDLNWREHPMVLVGMTTKRGLFVLETLATDHGMRVIYESRLAPTSNRPTVLRSAPHAEALGLVDFISLAKPNESFELHAWIIAPSRTRVSA
jgi:hypothetical protein